MFQVTVLLVATVTLFHCVSAQDNTKPCVLPFVYKGEKYDKCIYDSSQKLWCPLTKNYDTDPAKGWRYCPPELIAVPSKAPTQAPTQAPTEAPKKESCFFPFYYKKAYHSKCLFDKDSKKWWCATVENFDKKENKDKWIECKPEGDKCEFPFIFNGRRVHKCIFDKKEKKHWCSTTLNYDKDKKWKYCE